MRPIRPKIVASTATVRRADWQIRALFNRRTVDIFPPPGPDRCASFFARTLRPEDSNARLYLGDIDWYYFVHRGASNCRRQLWVDERGASGDIMDISIRGECGARRLMSDAAASSWGALGLAEGKTTYQRTASGIG